VLQSALEHYRRQQRITAAGLAAARRAQADARRLLAVVTMYQRAAAMDAALAVGQMLDEQGIDAPLEGRVNTDSLGGVASDGRPLGSLLEQAPNDQAFGLMVATQFQDAARMASGLAIAARPRVNGYIRMLNPPSCPRCVILAGKWFGWNAGFQRHPLCDCRHVPASEDTAGDLRTDPAAYFRSLDAVSQDRVFTKAGAQAIRDGADMNQVVNARRGANGISVAGGRLTIAEQRILRGGRDRGRLERVDVYGHQVFVTREGVTRRGVAGKKLDSINGSERLGKSRYASARAPRLMPESIYELAGNDRDEAIRLLKRFGYIL